MSRTKGNPFVNATDSKGFDIVNHNATDFGAFKDFQATLEDRFRGIEEKRSKEERLKNVKKWDSLQAARWRGASLRTIKNPAALEAERKIREHRFGSFFIQGASGVGKTYLGNAILRRYIGLGWVTPSQIKVISEESMLRIPQLGFSGQSRFEDLLHKDIKVYLFDSVGQRESDYDPKREVPLWEQMIDHVYSQSLAAIFTSTNTAGSFSDQLPGSASSKFRHLIEDKELTMVGTATDLSELPLSPEEEERNRRDQKKIDTVGLFQGK